MPSYLQSDIPVAYWTVASRRAVSICWKLRQRQLYDNPPAYRLSRSVNGEELPCIEAMGFGGKPIRQRIPPDPGGDPNNVSSKRPCRPVARSINRPDIERRKGIDRGDRVYSSESTTDIFGHVHGKGRRQLLLKPAREMHSRASRAMQSKRLRFDRDYYVSV